MAECLEEEQHEICDKEFFNCRTLMASPQKVKLKLSKILLKENAEARELESSLKIHQINALIQEHQVIREPRCYKQNFLMSRSKKPVAVSFERLGFWPSIKSEVVLNEIGKLLSQQHLAFYMALKNI